MIRLLASVASIEEATIAAQGGADLVDMKDPNHGALGALPEATIKQIRDGLDSAVVTSATTGDTHEDLEQLVASARRVAGTGVNYVKVALQSDFAVKDICAALAPLCDAGNALILVIFADDAHARSQLDAITALASDSAFTGIMLDTADKSAGGLRDCMSQAQLSRFIDQAKAHKLLSGLAGSLRIEDIQPLSVIGPDYLGFRGALCQSSMRTQGLDEHCIARVRQTLTEAGVSQSTAASVGVA